MKSMLKRRLEQMTGYVTESQFEEAINKVSEYIRNHEPNMSNTDKLLLLEAEIDIIRRKESKAC